MALSVLLGEDDLRTMPPELRERLLTWYFDRHVPTDLQRQPQLETPDKAIPSVIIDPNGENRRITFPELIKAGLLRPGDVIRCRPLKRQKRNGIDTYIGGAAVSADGSVMFGGERYYVPSKLARNMLNANGGNAKATNGYDYLFVEKPGGLVSLEHLREKLVGEETTPEEEAEVQTLMMDTEPGTFGSRKEALDWMRGNKSKR